MPLQVFDEVSPLRRALVHEPGPEVDAMVPSMMEELLFDDILYGERARDEHARFRRVLQLHGVEVLDAATLLHETLASEEARQYLLDVLLAEAPPDLREALVGQPVDALVDRLVVGLRREESSNPGTDVDDLFCIPPVPNYCFQRDTQVVLGHGIVHTSMAAAARHRETLLSRAIFRFHPYFRDAPVLFDLANELSAADVFSPERSLLEGGDVLIMSRDIVAVGLSERTNRTAIRHLARCLARREEGPRWMVVVELPRRRAYMHLDTLITMVDHGLCLMFAPVIGKGGAEEASTFVADLHADDLSFKSSGPLLETLAGLGLSVEPILCGGRDPVVQQREQWTDGANTLAIAPGVITLFDRNVKTLEELDRHGFAIVDAEDLLLGRTEPDVSRRVCLSLRSHEISRARGGPHCLCHPLVRA
ncbi:MAG: arginine deiminase family protein [Myxococcota bacterium]